MSVLVSSKTYCCSNFRHSVILTSCFVSVSLNLYCALQLRREKQHLEFELERAERESATYVTEVREVSLRNTTSSHVMAVHPPMAKELSLLSPSCS